MERKRLLSLNDLYNFFLTQNKTVNFSAAEDGSDIVVQIGGTINFQKTDKKKGLMPVTLQACHTDINNNNSRIDEKVMKDALQSFQNRPILGYIHDVDGVPEFYGHNMYLGEDGDLVYEEFPVGTIPESCKARLEYDSTKNKTYVIVDGYIYEEYSKAAEILRREGECSVSVELDIDQLSYDAENQVLVIDAFTFSGVTILGKDEDGYPVAPGMSGANIKIADFSRENNSMIKLMSELKDSLDRIYNAANTGETSEKGGNHNVKFEELLEQYGITAEDVTFEYDGLSDEELEAVFAEHFTQPEEDPAGAAEPEAAEEDGAADNEDETGDEGEDEVEKEFESAEDETIEHPEDSESVHMSVSYKDKTTVFSVSLKDKLTALYQLVNDTYADDCTWYDVDVYEETHHVIMVDMASGRGYKQSYKVKKDVYTLVGDRVEVFAQWLTADQISALDRMKSEYAEATEKLNHYEEEPKKMEILSSDDYSLIADNEAFVNLMKPENHFSLSIDEVTQKADAILTEAAKKRQFSVENHNQGVKPFATSSKKEKRFGSLFDGII